MPSSVSSAELGMLSDIYNWFTEGFEYQGLARGEGTIAKTLAYIGQAPKFSSFRFPILFF